MELAVALVPHERVYQHERPADARIDRASAGDRMSDECPPRRSEVDLVDNDDVDMTFLDLGEQTAQRRTLHRSTCEPAVVTGGSDQAPALHSGR